ncbi:YfiT family bacillithiol transferase [Deinococcus sp. QL22]|uniref:YfiT family bacillithiol transferase n=1 Tax=Deinococcus sp. QL22 TaxID=2939437 RepID=UPI0020183766|nr:putative metal-dependent hydrolase [Deinococcus sp. QL22]UQN05207.1 putative metal-dependent hydrolase [Deinococcus sp. QL22]
MTDAMPNRMPDAAAPDRRFPTGPMPTPLTLTPQERAEAVAAIRALPAELRAAVAQLGESQLDTPYREGGWTARQVVHHVGDSHLNAYARLKLTLTESNPTIRPYEQTLWAELPDSQLPVEVSLSLLDSLHNRIVAVLDGVGGTDWGGADWARQWTHPAQGRTYTLDTLAAMYAWHGRHHTAHLKLIGK